MRETRTSGSEGGGTNPIVSPYPYPNWGAPAGNRNALKHGAFTAAAIAERRAISGFLRDCWRTIREIERG